MEEIRPVLQSFSSVNLEELDKVALLDRIDTKYVFSKNQLPGILNRLIKDYNVLEVNNNRIFTYDSVYYDTDKFYLYNLHAGGRLNRYKVRSRKYVDSGLEYFEIKVKSNKGRTIKNRIQLLNTVEDSKEALQLLNDNTPFNISQLKALMHVGFNRITLVNKNLQERLTIDINLSFKNNAIEHELSNLVIAELKQQKSTKSAFSRIMKDYHIRSGSLSKYCLGIASLFNEVKKNNFKPMFLNLNKILHASPSRPGF